MAKYEYAVLTEARNPQESNDFSWRLTTDEYTEELECTGLAFLEVINRLGQQGWEYIEVWERDIEEYQHNKVVYEAHKYFLKRSY